MGPKIKSTRTHQDRLIVTVVQFGDDGPSICNGSASELASQSKLNQHAMTVLVADDDPAVRRGLRRLVHAMSNLLAIGEACDGAEAVRLALERQPSLVLMDISMPLLDGIEATRRIRLNAPNVRVIIVTANMSAGLVEKAFGAGADAFLSKAKVAEELPQALAALAAGERFISTQVDGLSERDRRRD